MSEHVPGRLVRRAPPDVNVLIGLPLTGQPFRCKEPRLVGGDGHIAADGDRPVIVDRELHLVALADMQRAPDLLGQRQLRLGANLHPGTKAGRRLHLGSWHAHSISSFVSKIFLLSHFIIQTTATGYQATSRSSDRCNWT